MSQFHQNVLSNEQISSILNHEKVLKVKETLPHHKDKFSLNFSIPLDDSIKSTLKKQLGLDLFGIKNVPMKYIKGDSSIHTDSGREDFQTTYVISLVDSSGHFLIENDKHPINKGSAYVFNEGMKHGTFGTEGTRLMIGPMSEKGFAVGAPSGVVYFLSEADALSYNNSIFSTTYPDYTLQTVSGFSSWKVASNSIGPASQSQIYVAGDTLPNDPDPGNPSYYYIYPAAPCFLEGSKILALVDGKDTYVNVENLKKGDLIKTEKDGYKKLVLLGKSTIKNPADDSRIENRLYKYTSKSYPELTEDLYLTGTHAVLVDKITEPQYKKTIETLGKLYLTGRKFRLIGFVDEKAEPWASEGVFPIWHFALENTNISSNYGVYANGLLVESTSLRYLKLFANMELV
jgi:hypothetical protein